VTIREEMQGWFRFLGVGLMAVGVLSGLWHPTWDNYLLREAVLGASMICVVGVSAYGLRCPRCHRFLMQHAHRFLDNRAPYACPKCGVSIDDPADSPDNLK